VARLSSPSAIHSQAAPAAEILSSQMHCANPFILK
jgi:hypothetical protein